MRRTATRLQAFWRDEKGAFATIFGILLIVIVATSGAVVDFVGIQQARTKAQLALDAATLGLQPHIFDWTDAELIAAAEDLVVERVADDNIAIEVEMVETNTVEGSLYFRAKLNVPTVFVSLVNVDSMDVRISSQATRAKLELEVVMVLDNSGSMSSYSRLTNLKTAANNAIDILFDYQPTQPKIFVGVVPFNFFVNVGAANASASWMADTAQSSIAWDNFDNDDDDTTTPSGNLDRLALFAGLTNVSWKGCVETRPYPYDTNDAAPDTSNPDTLFVPAFSPDWPDSYGSNYSYVDDHGGSCPGPTLTGHCEYTTWTKGKPTPRRDSQLYTDSSKTTLVSS
ncbi:MAG TPA: TadE/TadG family type IV pilus assembly protein, partial [Devosiaceae bacterium]|nr:TadE/TadG family type IV pilus assembly protein [Devosiaceae bacterium]